MRTLTISKCLPYIAGPSVFAFEEAKMLVKMGHTVEFLTYATYPDGILHSFDGRILHESGINFHFVEVPMSQKIVTPMLEVSMLSRAVEIVKTQKPDFVNAHYAIPHGLIAITLSKFFDIPSVVTVHGSDGYLLPKQVSFGGVSRLVFSEADLLIAISQSLRQEILRMMENQNPRAVEVLETAVEINKFARAGALPELKNSEPNILFVGRFAQEKRLDVLINAFSKVVRIYPEARLTLVGVGKEESKIRKQVSKLGLKNSVILINGAYQELPVIYQSADVFVLCSEKEGLPISLCEAAASSLPIVTTPVGSIPDFFLPCRNCLYTEVGNTEKLAEQITKLLASPELRQKMGAANLTLAKEKFDLEKRCERLIKIVEEKLTI